MLVVLAEAIWLIGFGQMPQLHEIFWLATVLRLLVVVFLLFVASGQYKTKQRRVIFAALFALTLIHLAYPMVETLGLALHYLGVATLTPNFDHFGLVLLAFGVPGALLTVTTRAFRR